MSIGKRRRVTRGQAIVEFALVLPLFTLLLLSASDFARGLSAYIELSNMAREGAHYGSMNEINAADQAGIEQAALDEAGGEIFGVVPTVRSTTGTYEPTGTQEFTYVRVTVTYRFKPIFSLPPLRTLTMRRTAVMQVLPG